MYRLDNFLRADPTVDNPNNQNRSSFSRAVVGIEESNETLLKSIGVI